ncbi:hypothetical protein STXM2123_6018 [Streptomyces sp. F-3]|nr:hypothetical protein STXM2123_6018 [Streptomyces sp. F-3]
MRGFPRANFLSIPPHSHTNSDGTVCQRKDSRQEATEYVLAPATPVRRV